MRYGFTVENQSPWLTDIYNAYLPYKTDGFLVEVGVGHTIAGVDKDLPQNLRSGEFSRCGSNTADLLDLGWGGIYIEPVSEYCEEAAVAHEFNLDKLRIANIAASDMVETLRLFLGDTFRPNDYGTSGYEWIGREIQAEVTRTILDNHDCPPVFDIMSIDVEGFEGRVLKGMDFTRHQPKVLIAETNIVAPAEIDFLLPNSYMLVRDDGLNGVWVNKGLQ